jgi:cyclase
MVLAKRIIPCLDFRSGRVVKGIGFKNLREVGDPTALAKKYRDDGADEIVFLDIAASLEERETLVDAVKRIASVLDIPFTVGGGVRSISDAKKLLENGADKVTINTSAIEHPDIIDELAQMYGSQCVVVSIDAKKEGTRYTIFTHSGTVRRELDALEWAKEAESRGAGELLVTSIDNDGSYKGYDTALLRSVTSLVNVPVIASGGCGSPSHFLEAFEAGCDAALAASIFHSGTYSIGMIKRFLSERGVNVRYEERN